MNILEEIAQRTKERIEAKKKELPLEVLKEMLPLFEAQEDYSIPAIEALCKDYIAKKELKNGRVLWPLRTAVSGKQMTPGGATEIMELLKKDESIARLEKAVEKLEAEA